MARQLGMDFEQPGGRRAITDVSVQGAGFEHKRISLAGYGAEIPRHTGTAIDEQAIASRTHQVRDVLVRTFACGAKRILSPTDDPLTALIERGELLAQSK